MFKFFDTIIDLIGTLVAMIKMVFESVINIFTTAIKGVTFSFEVIHLAPPFLHVFLTTLLGIGIAKFILSMGKR